MSTKRIQSILGMIEIAENNLRSAKILISQINDDRSSVPYLDEPGSYPKPVASKSISFDENNALEVVEGTFDGEQMVGDNGKVYVVPQNYASKTQLVVGDRMKWISLPDGEKFKLIQPVERERVTGKFDIIGDSYVVHVEEFPNPVKLLKASSTYAMKQLGLQPGDEVAIYVPKGSIPGFGAFINVVKSSRDGNGGSTPTRNSPSSSRSKKNIMDELESLNDFDLTSNKNSKFSGDEDYF